MERKNAIIAAVVVIIVIIVAVGAYLALSDNGGDEPVDEPTGDTYYFYLNGFEGDADGWYQAEGDNAADAANDALADSGLTYSVEGGWVSFEGYEGSYDAATGTGSGVGIYVYTSVDVTQPYSGYFFAGPTLDKVTGNIVYITYSEYTMDPETYATDYLGGPAYDTEWMTTGPFEA